MRWLFGALGVLAWTLAALFALGAAFLLYMDGRWAVWCGDGICEYTASAAVATGVAIALAVLGWAAFRYRRRWVRA